MSAAGSSGFLRRKEAIDDLCRLPPVVRLRLQLLSAALGERVELSPAIVVGSAPVRGDGAFLFQFDEHGIEGPLVYGEEVVADLFYAAGDAVAVLRPEHIEGLEDHQRQGALPDVLLLGGVHQPSCWIPK